MLKINQNSYNCEQLIIEGKEFYYMFHNEKEIKEFVDNFCNKNNIDDTRYEVSTISESTGGKNERVVNSTKVVNQKCSYVIKYYIKLDLFVIWKYSGKNTGMSYSLKTIRNKLDKGIFYSDKGKEFHTKNQSLVYFSYSKDFDKLLNCIENHI